MGNKPQKSVSFSDGTETKREKNERLKREKREKKAEQKKIKEAKQKPSTKKVDSKPDAKKEGSNGADAKAEEKIDIANGETTEKSSKDKSPESSEESKEEVDSDDPKEDEAEEEVSRTYVWVNVNAEQVLNSIPPLVLEKSKKCGKVKNCTIMRSGKNRSTSKMHRFTPPVELRSAVEWMAGQSGHDAVLIFEDQSNISIVDSAFQNFENVDEEDEDDDDEKAQQNKNDEEKR